MLDFFLEKQSVSADVDTATLARETTGLSGADLENIVNIAALTCINEVPRLTDGLNLFVLILSFLRANARVKTF